MFISDTGSGSDSGSSPDYGSGSNFDSDSDSNSKYNYWNTREIIFFFALNMKLFVIKITVKHEN